MCLLMYTTCTPPVEKTKKGGVRCEFAFWPRTIFLHLGLTHSSLAVLTLDVCVVWPFL